MTTVGAFEAKTNLSKLLEKVIKGEIIVITKHGVPIARLIPIAETSTQIPKDKIIDGFRKLRESVKPGEPSISSLRHERHKY